MPIYEYQCEACKKVIEIQQSLSDAPLTTCPTCASSVKKLISRSSFQLKGGGWYADGYSSGGSCGCEAKTASDTPATCPAKSTCGCGC